VPAKPELIGYEQTAAETQTAEAAPVAAPAQEAPAPESPAGPSEQQAEAQLFAYITEGYKESGEQRARFLPGKKTLGVALALAACGILAAPQAPWHRGLLSVWAHGHRAVHGWLNPQTVTAPQAPASHEDFARPGDEYKLPVAENIPDATTDPSQIRVIPVVDPTAKKPNTAAADAGPTAEQTEGTGTTPVDQSQAPAAQVQENAQAGTGATAAAPAVSAPTVTVPAAGGSATPGTAAGAAAAAEQLRSDAQAAASSPPLTAPGLAPPQPPIGQLPHSVSTPPATNSAIPQSLKSDIASMTPEASGTKSPEAALPSIEPVAIPEATARELLTDQPAPAYPASAKGQQGTVVLQVQIGRDGTVQNAKFLQGSLAFARAAIDAAKQWKFKPYLMNGRPVSVETQLTISFKPGA
jgi:TonB family protein